MNTTFLTVTLVGSLLAGQNANPAWQTSYSQAQRIGAEQMKPLAVVFGAGANGWSKVVREAPSAEVSKILTDNYICVYVDTTTEDGKRMAQTFGIGQPTGLVISDRAGSLQAFWHQGDLTNEAMTSYLRKYADPQIVVRGTETTNSSRTSFYPPNSSDVNWGAAGGSSYCPSCNNARGFRR